MADWDVVEVQPVKTHEEMIAQYFPPDAVPTATKIMNAESSGNPSAINTNTNKTTDRGLFQINDVHIPELKEQGIINTESDLMYPETNIKAASYLYNKSGTQPWNASKKRWSDEGNDWDVVSQEPEYVPENFDFKPGTVGQEGMSPGGFVRNVGRNLVDIVGGVKDLITNSPQIAEFAQKYDPTSLRGIKNIVTEPEPILQMGKEIGKSLLGAVQHPVRTLYEHPVDVGLAVSPLAEVGAISTASKFPRVASVLSKVAKVTEPANVLKATGARMPENIAARLINSRIKPRMRDFSYGKNPGLGVAREGIVATSLEDLSKKIATRRDVIGKQIDSIVRMPRYSAMTIDGNRAVKVIDDAIIKASKNPRSNAAVIQRLVNAKEDLLQAYTLPTGQLAYTRNLASMSPADALALKRDLGEITKWTGSMSDDAIVNKSLKQMYGEIDRALDRAIPELKTLNERYANMSGAYVATKHREMILGRQNLVHIPGLAAGIGTGVMTGEPLTGMGALILYETLSSTLSKTAAASVLAKMGVRMPQTVKGITTAGRAGVVSNIIGAENMGGGTQ